MILKKRVKLLILILIITISLSSMAVLFVNLLKQPKDVSTKAGEYAGYEWDDNTIYDKSTLINCLQNTNNMDEDFTIINDIDLSGYNWTPVGTMRKPFTGSLVGDYYNVEKDQETGKMITISNLTINLSKEVVQKFSPLKYDISYSNCVSYYKVGATEWMWRFFGFFGIVKDATIKNIRFENVTFNLYFSRGGDHNFYTDSSIYFGTICGRTYGKTTIEDCEVRNLNIHIDHLSGGAWYSRFFISSLVGFTADIYNESVYSNTSNNTGKMTLSNTNKAITTINNVVVAGDISVTNDGWNSIKNTGYLYFYGIATRTASNFSNSNQQIKINNACFLPNNEVFYTQSGKGWSTNWKKQDYLDTEIEDASYFTITPDTQYCTELCTKKDEISKLEVSYNDASDYSKVFYYDSTVYYTGKGKFVSNTKYTGVSSPILISGIRNLVCHVIEIEDPCDQLQKIEFIAENYFLGNVLRIAPCELTYYSFNTSLNVGMAQVIVTPKNGNLDLEWKTSVEEGNNNYDGVVFHSIETSPPEGKLLFDDKYVDGDGYEVEYPLQIEVSFIKYYNDSTSNPLDYYYVLTFRFTDIYDVTHDIIYKFGQEYYINTFTIIFGSGAKEECDVALGKQTFIIGRTCTEFAEIIPNIFLKEYGWIFM